MSFRRFCCLLLAASPVFLLLAATVPPFDDELYYWCWSRELQLSYYDHPPMVAYLIRLSTTVFGDSILAIRLPAVLSGLVVVGVIGWLSRPRDLLPLVYLSPVLTFAAVMVTPDTPLLMFWALYLVWLVKVHERLAATLPSPDRKGGGDVAGSPPPTLRSGFARNQVGLWLVGGLILGCGVLGKYTTGLAGVAGFVSFAVAGRPRRWVAGYALHAGVAFLVASPILIHNIRHDFAPIRYQWGHSMGSPEPGFVPFAEFVGVQLLLFGTVPFAVFVWAVRNRRELLADPRLRVCACLFALPFAFFLLKATRGRLEGNWAFPCYLACWPLAAAWYDRVRASASWRWAARAGFAVPVGFTLFLAVHLVEPVPFLPLSADRATRQWSKMEVARAVATDLRAAGYDGPVYVPTYQWTALLRWHGVDARQVHGFSRPSHFTERPPTPIDPARAVVFTEGPAVLAAVEGIGPTRSATGYPLVVRGRQLTVCWLLDCSESGGGIGRPVAAGAAGRLDPDGATAQR